MTLAHGHAVRRGNVIYLACATAFVAVIWVTFRGSWPPDLSAVYFGALSYAEGDHHLIYLSPEMFFGGSASDAWSARAAALGPEGALALPYVYAPIWAAVLAPVAAHLDPVRFFDVALLVHAVLCAAGVGLAYRIAGPSMSLTRWSLLSFGVLLVASPVFISFWLNQPQIFVTFLILLAFERYKSGALIAAGIILGFAAALKLAPAALALIFVLDRAWKPLCVSVGTGLALLGISLLVAGPDLHYAFLLQLQKAGNFLIVTPLNYGAEALFPAVGGMFDQPPLSLSETAGYAIYASSAWVGVAGLVCYLIVAGMLFVAGGSLVARLMALWAALILFGPLGWSHYLIGPLLLLPAFLTGRTVLPALLALGLVSSPLTALHATTGLPVVVPIACGVSAILLLIGLGLRGGGGSQGASIYAGQN
ncbi:DUF2029 domain-containing protein [Loktanella sp. IMCC34160]|uniref:glycosyltransferase family 87 protein n=1 Tax=Loktanella sp. IMCC34160 TaxID=2510646 RepID=UPI00101E199E|nr:glycosyltransferase family 87 protein [Loktanella sp. IMCC34160]RYG91144.1 DUF2029 domain-containing protein [Loktanella sp. IMCC34160]